MDQQTLEYALLAGRAYERSRKPENRIPEPAGWTQLTPEDPLGHTVNTASGFEAVAFQKGNEIVISYAGTDFTEGADKMADAILGLGFINQQLIDAALYYKRIQAANPGATITFTGHSLGGGLAAVMGVFFNQKAVTFDPAPFRLLATQDNARKVAAALKSNGFGSDAMLDYYTTTEQSVATAIPDIAAVVALLSTALGGVGVTAALAYLTTKKYPTTISNESNITGVALDGEVLTSLKTNTAAERIALQRLKILGSPLEILPNGGVGSIPSTEMHSMALLIAIAKEPRLGTLAEKLPGLYATFIDKTLYGADTKSSTTNFLEQLVRREYGSTGPGSSANGSGFLSKFATDLTQLVGTEGTAHTNRALRDALIIPVMEYYYSTQKVPE